jgi:indole-3-acetate monooxygenase
MTNDTRYKAHTSDGNVLLDAARRLGPLIREHAEAGEQRRRLSAEVIDAMREAGLFRMLLPKALGGLETDPFTCSRVVEEIAGFHSAAAWLMQAGNTGAWWAARYPKEGCDEIYKENPSVLMAAVIHPPQQAVETMGGYKVTGRGPLASNVHDSEWLLLSAVVMDGDRPKMLGAMPQAIGLTVRTSEVKILDTWHSLGMRATDSNDVVVDSVFVPAHRTFPLVPEFEPGPYHRGPLYRFPAIGAVPLTIAPVALAVARAAISEVKDLARHKTAFGFGKPLRERGVVQTMLARAEAMLRSARLLYYDTLVQAWDRTFAGERSTLEQKADLLLGAAHAAATASEVTDRMHRIAGTTGIYAKNSLERLFRDAQTLRHHGFMSENRFDAVGQVYLGLEPEFMMLAF